MTYKKLRLILGDQLNRDHSWYKQVDKECLYVMMEIRPESEYVTHHIQKIVGIFGAMREFGKFLRSQGHDVRYYKIIDADNCHSFAKNCGQLIKAGGITQIEYQEPDEYRLDEILHKELSDLGVQIEVSSTEHFLTERLELKEMFAGKKQYLMESFYRAMRKKYDILMDDGRPVTGKWNYDHENRKKLPKGQEPPMPITFEHDVSELYTDIQSAGLSSIGSINFEKFIWPLTRQEALYVLDYFVEELLPHFGKYQDALSDHYWSLYHSRLSFALNVKLISPSEVINRVEEAWSDDPERVSISQAEGFIRQILGWREYMRGIYWAHMPDYAQKNYFKVNRKLPSWYWTGATKMNCLSKAINQSLEYAYAHHIQRLMVTGNFALLSGVHPDEVDAWYLGIYIDAFDWVEITNTRGMSQYADGGIVGTKPYISSASYINKMGDHCKGCYYNHKEKLGELACPFNSLYWSFLATHRDLLASNPRMSMMYRVWDKMEGNIKTLILEQAEHYLDNIETL